VLKWARENWCRWAGGVCFAAAGGRHLDVLKWAYANGCPTNKLSDSVFITASPEMRLWAHEKGFLSAEWL